MVVQEGRRGGLSGRGAGSGSRAAAQLLKQLSGPVCVPEIYPSPRGKSMCRTTQFWVGRTTDDWHTKECAKNLSRMRIATSWLISSISFISFGSLVPWSLLSRVQYQTDGIKLMEPSNRNNLEFPPIFTICQVFTRFRAQGN